MRMNDENDESDLIGLEEMVIGSNSFPVATSMTLRMLPNVREIVLSNNTLNEVEVNDKRWSFTYIEPLSVP